MPPPRRRGRLPNPALSLRAPCQWPQLPALVQIRGQCAKSRSKSLVSAVRDGTCVAIGTEVHPGMVAAARRRHLPMRLLTPEHIDDVLRSDDLVSPCATTPPRNCAAAVHRIHWSIPDSVRAGEPEAFDHTLAALTERIDRLVLALQPLQQRSQIMTENLATDAPGHLAVTFSLDQPGSGTPARRNPVSWLGRNRWRCVGRHPDIPIRRPREAQPIWCRADRAGRGGAGDLACGSDKNAGPSYAGSAKVDCGGKQSLKASGSTAQANAMTQFIDA